MLASLFHHMLVDLIELTVRLIAGGDEAQLPDLERSDHPRGGREVQQREELQVREGGGGRGRRPDRRRPPVQRRRLLLRQVAKTDDPEEFFDSGVRTNLYQAAPQRSEHQHVRPTEELLFAGRRPRQ